MTNKKTAPKLKSAPHPETPQEIVTHPPKPTRQEKAEFKEEKLLRSLDEKDPMNQKKSPLKKILLALIVTSLGVATGFGLSYASQGKISDSDGGVKITKSAESAIQQGIQVGDIVGSPDEKTFRDSAEGVLVQGGVEGEGSHHIMRPGGPSQNVYLTSSVMDLTQFEDHKVKIWGETFAAQKAGWLMDVGRLEVLELDAQKPFEE